jgi:hypothetical protein
MKAFDNLAYEAKHEKPQGIQWNKYPDKEPTKNGDYLAIHKKEGLILAEYHGGFGLDGLVISHWAEVNLPE